MDKKEYIKEKLKEHLPPEYYNLLLNNMERLPLYFGADYRDISEYEKNPKLMVNDAFTHGESNEGGDFWSNMYHWMGGVVKLPEIKDEWRKHYSIF